MYDDYVISESRFHWQIQNRDAVNVSLIGSM